MASKDKTTVELMHDIASGKMVKDVDLGRSFDQLKKDIGDHPATTVLIGALKKAKTVVDRNKGKDADVRVYDYVEGYSMLSAAIQAFLIRTTEIKFQDIQEMLNK